MNFNKWIITDENNRIIHIGADLLSIVLKRDMLSPVGYASGQMSAGDFYLIVIPDIVQLNICDKTKIEYVSRCNLPQNGGAILVGAEGNFESPFLLKTWDKISQENETLLQTIYHGHRICIFLSEDDERQIEIRIDDQRIRSYIDGIIPMVIFNRSGVKFFRTHEKSTLQMSICDVMDGKVWSSYWNSEKTKQVQLTLDDAIRSELLTAMKSLEVEEYRFISMKNDVLVRRLSPIESFKGYKLWLIQTMDELLNDIRVDTDLYHAMGTAAKRKRIHGEVQFGLWGESEKTEKIRYLLQKSSVTNTTILLTGESGTGKSFLAKEIHKNSKRSQASFVHVNCAAIPYNLIGSELFGYEEGAFTGAKKGGRGGYFELAEGGTLFLDEISELPLPLQGKLLEVMQSKTYFRVGGTKKKMANVRIVAATNQNLQELVAERRFREDLYYRIHVFPIHLPPLREQKEAIRRIAADLIPDICNRLDVNQQVLSPDAVEKMIEYDWPGNIRELENVLEKACILSNGKVIYPEDIDISLDMNNNIGFKSIEEMSLKQQKENFERNVIEKTLAMYEGSKIKTAKHLGIGRTSLFEKINKYGIKDVEEKE